MHARTSSGRISRLDALRLLFRFRATVAANRGSPNSIYAVIADNLSKNGGSDSNWEPAKDGDPNLPLG